MTFIKTHLKTIIIVAVIAVVIILGIRGYLSSKKNTSNIYNPKTDSTVVVKRQTIKDTINLTGSVDAVSKANLAFQTPGQLSWLGVKVGDKVRKYQSLASLNKDQLKKQLQISFNNYRSTLSTFDDTQENYKDVSNITDDMKRILIRTQNTLDNSVLSYELNDLTLKYATLSSPFDGVVTYIDAPASGVNITPASVISVIDPKSVYFRSEIDQEDVVKIKVGDKATITLDSFPDKTFESTVNYIAFTPVAGQSSTVYEIRLNLDPNNSDLQYRLGMDGDVNIELKEDQNALTISSDAVREESGKKYVYTKDNNNNLNKVFIKTGIETDTDTEILEGLSENDQIVIKK
jgi:RND family efflux transporter MFP subunit